MLIKMTIPALHTWDILLLGLLAGLWLYQLYFYCRYMAGILRAARRERQSPCPEPQAWPGVSIIVCAKNEEDNLQRYLQALLAQRYKGEYEVIVVNDASEDGTQYVLDEYARMYPNLRLSFVPAEAWVRSSKKLAITLAAKAAKYDYLLLTDADCRPESSLWIESMMRGFLKVKRSRKQVEMMDFDVSPVEVVLGFGGYFEQKGAINRLIQYDTLFSAMRYMGMAASRHPYMGVGRCLAYRKRTFFDNKGFSGILNERAGEDTLFINRVATARNTQIVVSPDSVTWSLPKQSWRQWREQKYRHVAVLPRLKWTSKLLLGFEPLTRALLYLVATAAVVLSVTDLLGVTAILATPLIGALAFLLMVIRLIWQSAVMTRTAHHFGMRGFGLMTVKRYEMYLPLCTLMMLIRHAFRYKKEQKW